MSTDKEEKVLEGHTGWVYSVAVSKSDELVVSGSKDKTVRVWNVNSGQQTMVLQGHTDRVWSVAISSEDEFIVSGSSDKRIMVWSLASG